MVQCSGSSVVPEPTQVREQPAAMSWWTTDPGTAKPHGKRERPWLVLWQYFKAHTACAACVDLVMPPVSPDMASLMSAPTR